MKVSACLLAVTLAATVPLQAGEPTSPTTTEQGLPVLSPRAPEPPSATLRVGDRAPDFSWQDAERRTIRLRDVLAQGSLLLIFGPGDGSLRALEHERDALLDLGVVPVAVVNLPGGAAAGKARRLQLHYALVPDSRRVIANQYDTVDEVRQTTLPAWFVVDRGGRVRALDRRGLPTSGFARLAATALAVPTREVGLPTRAR